jgi:hypothetical protein
MGRHTTGIITTGQACRIELKYLLKQGYIQKDCRIPRTLSWSDGSSMQIYSVYTNSEKYIKLTYTLTERATGKKFEYDYEIELVEIPSNLGKGNVLFFVCPESYNRCRILYRCYGYHKFKCRKAYRTRIYYNLQIQSEHYYNNERYFRTEEKLNKLESERRSYYYKGKPTKRLKRILKLQQDLQRLDSIRFSFFSEYLISQYS